MKKGSKEELNRLGREWYEAESPEKQKIAEDIFFLAYKLFDKPAMELKELCGKNLPMYSDAMDLFFCEDWNHFNPNTGDLYSYIKKRVILRLIDMVHQDRGDHRVKNIEQPEKRKWVSNLSFDMPIDEDGETTLLDQYGDQHAVGDTADALLYDETAVQFINLFLNFPERLHGRAKNAIKLNYYRMFFTDKVVEILHGGHDTRPFAAHERELFDHGMKTSFLDYFMRAVCRRISELCVCPVKPYGELVEGRPMDREPGHPLPNDVYMTYLNTREGYAIRSAGAISNQREEYESFLRESLC